MKSLADLLNAAALRAGLPADNADLVGLLTNADLAKIKVPEALEQALEGMGTIQLEAAKQNPELKKYFRTPLLNSLDAEFQKLASLLGPDFAKKVEDETNTFQKPALFKEAIKALKDSGKKDGEDETEAKKQLKALNEKLAEYQESYVPKSELEGLKNSYEQQILDRGIYARFAGQQWTEAIMPEFRGVVAKAALEKELAAMGAKLVYSNGEEKLVQAADPTLDFLLNHQPVSLDSLVGTVMTKNKFTEVSQPKPNNSGVKTVEPSNSGPNNANASSGAFGRLLSDSLKDQGVQL